MLTSEQIAAVSEAAAKYGDGKVAFTSRLTVEVPGISFENIELFQEYIGKTGLVTGGTGAKVRPIVACKGTTCVFGLHDTQAMAAEIHERFFEGYKNVPLPHKFKIAVGGCPNNCVKPDLNDIGIVGQRVPKLNTEKCKKCKKCFVAQECPMNAVSTEGSISFNTDKCNNCGRCILKCPFGAMEDSEVKYKIYVGGRWGKSVIIGKPLKTLFTRQEAISAIEKAILLYKSKGIAGERFGQTVERLGVEEVEKMLISDQLLQRKEEILSIEK